MQNFDGKTADLVSANIGKMKELFPEAFAEGKLNFEVLEEILGEQVEIDNEKERYSFNWNGKRNAIRLATQVRSAGTLRPMKNDSVNWGTTENLFIEGDNLEVLRLLQSGYMGKVKMIYIDPPYNTGKDFVYKDDFVDNVANFKAKEGLSLRANADTRGRYHTDWLNMMYPRLKLARNLLREDGVIFISIDENEESNLRKICDEVFGENNFVNKFCWLNNLKGRQISDFGAAKTSESVLVYSREAEQINLFEISVDSAKSVMPSGYKGFNYEVETDEVGEYVVKNELYNSNSMFNEETRPNLVYRIHYNFETGDVKFSEVNDEISYDGYIQISPNKNNDGKHRYHAWRWSKEKVRIEIRDLKFVKTPNGVKIYTKIRGFLTTALKDVITDITSNEGSRDFESLFEGKKFFDFPKPVNLIKLFLLQSDRDTLILDFFAGSATTAQAVMQLNVDDGGNRKFIMVQIPEATPEDSEARNAGYGTISEISRERIRRAGKKIIEENAEKLKEREHPLDIGFKAFALDETNFKKWDPSAEDIGSALFSHANPLKEERSDEDALYEILLKYGINLTEPVEELSWNGKKIYRWVDLVITFDRAVTKEFVEWIAAMKPLRVVFLDAGFEGNDALKENVTQILREANADVDVKSL